MISSRIGVGFSNYLGSLNIQSCYRSCPQVYQNAVNHMIQSRNKELEGIRQEEVLCDTSFLLPYSLLFPLALSSIKNKPIIPRNGMKEWPNLGWKMEKPPLTIFWIWDLYVRGSCTIRVSQKSIGNTGCSL
jgi:hypothetical protein